MFNILIADDNHEERELLKLEILQALDPVKNSLNFFEAASIKDAKKLLTMHLFDLMTLDIEFDRMNEGIAVLPELFENYPTLNIVIISGKLNKGEVSEQLFRFTRDNVLKGKRWARHFDVLDKKDNKTEALRRAYEFAFKQKDVAANVRELFLLAESYLEQDMIDKCLEVYRKIQRIAPGEPESKENIGIFKSDLSIKQALEYLKNGERIVAALLLGHNVEKRLKSYTTGVLGYFLPALSDCLKELERGKRLLQEQKEVFQRLMALRNKCIHQPSTVIEKDFEMAIKNLQSLGVEELRS